MGGFHFTENAVFDFFRQRRISSERSEDFFVRLDVVRFLYLEKFMKENKLADLSVDFSVNILNLCDQIQGHYSLKNQLERSATSIGANIREARYAQSSADLISKLQIALKECYETEYWLELIQKASILPGEILKKPIHNCGSIRRMLISSITTLKNQ